MEDLVAEILLRLPPDNPACVVRAALVCKPWRRLLTDSAFLRRYRAFHRKPPLLGFIHILFDHNLLLPDIARFVPTSAFCPADPHHRDRWTLDCRHGRALLYSNAAEDSGNLGVWDPMTGDRRWLRRPDVPHMYFTAAVLCAAGGGCDHRDCHGGPFLVVFVGTDQQERITWACAYSSETGAWSAPASVHLDGYIDSNPSAVIGSALYFVHRMGGILRYDLGGHSLSAINLPGRYDAKDVALMAAEDGYGLGLAAMGDFSLHLWSLETGPEGVAAWARRRVIELRTLLPIDALFTSPRLIGFAEGTHIVFVNTDAGVFSIELKSMLVRKLCESLDCCFLFPYMSFYNPRIHTWN